MIAAVAVATASAQITTVPVNGLGHLGMYRAKLLFFCVVLKGHNQRGGPISLTHFPLTCHFVVLLLAGWDGWIRAGGVVEISDVRELEYVVVSM